MAYAVWGALCEACQLTASYHYYLQILLDFLRPETYDETLVIRGVVMTSELPIIPTPRSTISSIFAQLVRTVYRHSEADVASS